MALRFISEFSQRIPSVIKNAKFNRSGDKNILQRYARDYKPEVKYSSNYEYTLMSNDYCVRPRPRTNILMTISIPSRVEREQRSSNEREHKRPEGEDGTFCPPLDLQYINVMLEYF